MSHLHIDTRLADRDLSCVLPLERAEELLTEGALGELAPTHYSFMGYLPRAETFLEESVPTMIERMRSEEVDAVLAGAGVTVLLPVGRSGRPRYGERRAAHPRAVGHA